MVGVLMMIITARVHYNSFVSGRNIPDNKKCSVPCRGLITVLYMAEAVLIIISVLYRAEALLITYTVTVLWHGQ